MGCFICCRFPPLLYYLDVMTTKKPLPIRLIAIAFTALFFFTACGDGSAKKSSYTPDQQDEIRQEALNLVNAEANPYEVLDGYKKLIEFDEVDSDARQVALKYLLKVNLQMVEDNKGEEALALAKELDKLIPNDFYIQNRILGAYRVMAEKAIEEKDYDKAYDLLYNTALKIRFDIEVMRTYLHLLTVKGEEAISAKDYSNAKAHLDEVVWIVAIDNNSDYFGEEKANAERLLKTLPPGTESPPPPPAEEAAPQE